MGTPREHDRILANEARGALAPLGFKRKGRSRLWFADHGFWLCVVEFQPSAWSKGSYLNVSPHWLWGITDGLSFDRPVDEVRDFIEFDTAAAFTDSAAGQAQIAARTSLALADLFSDVRRTADILVDDQERLGRGGWTAFNAAMASGMAGDVDIARRLLQTTIDSMVGWRSDFDKRLYDLMDATSEPGRLRGLVEDQIAINRSALGLNPRWSA